MRIKTLVEALSANTAQILLDKQRAKLNAIKKNFSIRVEIHGYEDTAREAMRELEAGTVSDWAITSQFSDEKIKAKWDKLQHDINQFKSQIVAGL